MMPAMDKAGCDLVDMALVARNCAPPQAVNFGTFCPACGQIAAIACQRRPGIAVAHLSCTSCRRDRSARIDIPAEAVDSGTP